MSFPERLKYLQRERNVKQKDVFQSAGLSESAYYKYIQGSREPTLSKCIALADFYGISLDFLAGRTNNPQIAR